MSLSTVVSLQRRLREKAIAFDFLNRSEKKIVGRIWDSGMRSRLVVIAHGLGGSQEQPQIEACASCFSEYGCNVITFDFTNSFGSSDGKIEEASLTQYANDLEDLLKWVQLEAKFKGKIVICGFSLGASAAIVNHIEKRSNIASILAFAPVISGNIWLRSLRDNSPGNYAQLSRLGFFEKYDSLSERSGAITQSFVEDVCGYDLFADSDNIRLPILLAVGSKDKTCPPEYIKELGVALGENARVEILDNLPHTIQKSEDIKILKDFINKEIRKKKRNKGWWNVSKSMKSG